MGEISFEARNHYCFRDYLIKFAITFYCCVEFLEFATPLLCWTTIWNRWVKTMVTGKRPCVNTWVLHLNVLFG